MRLVLSPQRSDAAEPVMSVAGSVLTVDGEPFDFSGLDDAGDVLPEDAIDAPWFAGARNDAGTIEVTVVLPIGPRATEAQRFPEPVNVASGAVTLPEPPAEDQE